MIDGPYFKDKQYFLKGEGWPAGTECWYHVVTERTFRFHVCASTADESKARAERLIAAIQAGNDDHVLYGMMEQWTAEKDGQGVKKVEPIPNVPRSRKKQPKKRLVEESK